MRYVALLRGINVGGNKMVSMADLRQLCQKIGFHDPATFLQSGNLIFDVIGQRSSSLEKLLERETARRLKIEVDFVVRSAKEWLRAMRANPFPDEAKSDPGRLVVMFMKKDFDPNLPTLQAAIRGPEVTKAVDKQLYVVYPNGIGRSKLTHGLIEQKLGTRGTGRNWNTVSKLWAIINK